MVNTPRSHLGIENAGAMLVAYRLAGLSALEAHYAAINGCARCGPAAMGYRGARLVF